MVCSIGRPTSATDGEQEVRCTMLYSYHNSSFALVLRPSSCRVVPSSCFRCVIAPKPNRYVCKTSTTISIKALIVDYSYCSINTTSLYFTPVLAGLSRIFSPSFTSYGNMNWFIDYTEPSRSRQIINSRSIYVLGTTRPELNC